MYVCNNGTSFSLSEPFLKSRKLGSKMYVNIYVYIKLKFRFGLIN